MSISQIILKQVAIMFILMMIGYLLYKKKMISDQGSKDLGKILIYLVIPVVIVNNFCIEKTPENVEALIFSAIIALISMLVAMFVSYLVFKDKNGIASFSSSFSNAGFVGIPIVQATLGNHAVFYISMMIAFVNILQWTYGIFTITNDKSAMSFKKICTNPVVIAVTLGLLIFFFQIPVSQGVKDMFNLIAGTNTLLAMLVCGVFLAQSDLLAMLTKKNTYLVCMLRLFIIPLITLIVFKLIPFGGVDLKLAILISAASPVGNNVAIFAQEFNKDYLCGVEHVCMSTLLCLISLPIIITLASAIL